MEIPKSILEIVEKLKEERFADIKRREEIQADWDKVIKELNDEKLKRKDELLQYEKFVVSWMKEFLSIKEVEMIFAVTRLTDLEIYGARFWKGFPDSSPTVWACIALKSVSNDGEVVYSERYKGHSLHSTFLGSTLEIKDCAVDLISGLHPEFLKGLYEHIKSGKVWDFIEVRLGRVKV